MMLRNFVGLMAWCSVFAIQWCVLLGVIEPDFFVLGLVLLNLSTAILAGTNSPASAPRSNFSRGRRNGGQAGR